MYINKLFDLVNKYKNTYRKTIKIKPVDVKTNTYNNSSKEINDKDPKFKIRGTIRISKCRNIFAKGYVPNLSEDVFLIKKIVPRTYVISDLSEQGIVGTFYKKRLQKPNQKEFKVEKVIKGNDDKLYVKWKGYNYSLNSWIEKKDIV